jgi:hypothetical protein
MGDLVEQPRLGQRQILDIVGVERTDEAGVEAIEAAQLGDGVIHGAQSRSIS